MTDERQRIPDDAAVSEGDPEWRSETQRTNEEAEELSPPRPAGDEEEGTGPYVA